MYNCKRIPCLVLMLSISLLSYSQVISDEEHKLLVDNAILETANWQKNNPPSNPVAGASIASLRSLDDLDDDGMDDDWETDNGLDPMDPFDAWDDFDGDKILNLFEFQLETDPNNEISPAIFELDPSVSENELDDMIEEAENDIRVIRLSQGEYSANVLAVFEENFRIMIQGGWNDDFSEHNPEMYPTNWLGLNDEALNILVPVSNDVVSKSTVILQGINF